MQVVDDHPKANLASPADAVWLTQNIAHEIEVHADLTLYDRAELADRLGADANPTDLDLLVAAWAHFGTDCAGQLNGDFAFVIEDRARGLVFAARDHIGVRPFFYRLDKGQLRFASSIRALVDPDDPDSDLDNAYIVDALAVGMPDAGERTFYSSIRRLLPGHCLELSAGQLTVRKYWHPDRIEPLKLPDEASYIERGRAILREAVADRVEADETYGIHLTGGLDSSAIATIATEHLRAADRADPLALSWLETGPDLAENEADDLLAIMQAKLDLEVVVSLQSKQGMVDLLLSDLARDFDMGDLIAETASQNDAADRGITTVLSGWGGDEFLSFNARGLPFEYLKRGRLLALADLSGERSVRGFIRIAKSAIAQRFDLSRKQLPGSNPEYHLAAPQLRNQHSAAGPIHFKYASVRKGMLSAIDKRIHASRLESWAISGGVRGIRYRFPLLDRRVIEFALSVPSHLYRKGTERRRLFREITKGLLPESVRLNTSKFETDRVKTLRRNFAEVCKSYLPALESQDGLRRARFVDMERLTKAVASPDLHEAQNLGQIRRAMQFLDLP